MNKKKNRVFVLVVLFLSSIIMMTACTEQVIVDPPQKHPLVVGQKCAMKGYVESRFGAYVDHWDSQNPDVATIGYYTGLVEARKIGNSVITAYGKRNSDSFELNVTDKGYLSQIDLNDTIIISLQGYATVNFRSSNSILCQTDNQVAGIVAATSSSMFTYLESISIDGVNYCPINDGSVSEYANSIVLAGKAVGITQLHIYNDSVNIDEHILLKVVQE